MSILHIRVKYNEKMKYKGEAKGKVIEDMVSKERKLFPYKASASRAK